MKILLFGGTTEGRVLAEQLIAAGHEVTISVATPLGAERFRNDSSLHLIVGRLDQNEMADLLKTADICVDATHPYATEVTRNIRAACEMTKVPLRRLCRPASEIGDCVRVNSCVEAADFLKGQSGNVLLTIGTKELSAFENLSVDRLFARVLPTHAALNACEKLGLPHKNILALQGPFTQKLNEAMLEQYRIRWLVTKDGGDMGGFSEKQAAANSKGVEIILICRPFDEGISMEEIQMELGDFK